MRFSFTAATERAIAFASDWCSRTGREELDPSHYWWGCCRNRSAGRPSCCRSTASTSRPCARMADARAHLRKSQNPPCTGGRPAEFPSPPRSKIRSNSACDRLDFLPRRPELATEHLLLGLASADHEVAVWLRQRGVDPDALEAEIRGLYGYVLPDALDEAATTQVADSSRRVPLLLSVPAASLAAPPRTDASSASSTPPPTAPARDCGWSRIMSALCSTTGT